MVSRQRISSLRSSATSFLSTSMSLWSDLEVEEEEEDVPFTNRLWVLAARLGELGAKLFLLTTRLLVLAARRLPGDRDVSPFPEGAGKNKEIYMTMTC